MSWVEYNDMFERVQEKGEYHLFVFDLKGSRSIGYFIRHINLLLYGIYFRIKDLEKRFEDNNEIHFNEISRDD